MTTKTQRNFVGVITNGEAASSVWEQALADRLEEEMEVVLMESHDLEEYAHILKNGICVARSTTDSVVRRLAEIGAEVILISDAIGASVPEGWIVLPFATSPLHAARIAGLFLQNKALSDQKSIPKTKFESATYAHSHSIWENVLQFSSSVESSSTLSGRLRNAVPLLNNSLYGAHVTRIAVEKEHGKYLVVKPGDEWPIPFKISPGLIAQLRSGNLVMDGSAGGELRQHLASFSADMIVLVRGEGKLLGWFLVAVNDCHQIYLNKPLAKKVAEHIGLLIHGREQINELTSLRHAVQEGLDQLETGISILNKEGFPLLENQAAYEISRKLGCASYLIPEVRTAIHQAKIGHPTDTLLDEYTVHASAWGSLHNGCVLQTRSRALRGDDSMTSLDSWIEEWQASAKRMGLELSLKVEEGRDLSLIVPESLCIESVCRYLSGGQMSRKVNAACEVTARIVRFHFDQEFSEGTSPLPESFQRAPASVDVSYASLGRRITVEVLRHQTAKGLVLDATT